MKKIINIIPRYFFLLIVVLFGIDIIYLIFTPLTIYPVWVILSLVYHTVLLGNTLIIEEKAIEIIGACVAGAAYLLLLILNFSTAMSPKKRIYSILYSFIILLLLNIFRIILLSIMFINEFALFDLTHKIFWYGLSTIFVVCIWFSEVKIFKIKNIPIYSDLKYLIGLVYHRQ